MVSRGIILLFLLVLTISPNIYHRYPELHREDSFVRIMEIVGPTEEKDFIRFGE